MTRWHYSVYAAVALLILGAILETISPWEQQGLQHVEYDDPSKIPCGELDALLEPSRISKLDPNLALPIKLGPLKFNIPWKYFSPRPHSTSINCSKDWDRIGLQFWVPSGDAPFEDHFWKGLFKPSEIGRDDPEKYIWVMEITELKYYDLNLDKRYDLDRVIAGVTRLGDSESISSDFGLTLVKSKTYPDSPPRWYHRDADTALFIQCATMDDDAICNGVIQLRDLNLGASFLMPKHFLSSNQVLAPTMRSLFAKWAAD